MGFAVIFVGSRYGGARETVDLVPTQARGSHRGMWAFGARGEGKRSTLYLLNQGVCFEACGRSVSEG